MPMEGETGQLAPHYTRAGLGKGLPMHPCPCGLPWGWMGQWGCAPLNPWNPQGQGCSPKGTWEQPLHSPGLTLTASHLCHRATMCWRMRTPLPHRKTVKGPGLLLSPHFQLTVTASGGCCAIPSSPAAIRESPGGLCGPWNQGNISHSGDTHRGAEHQWVGGASQPRVPQRSQCGTWTTDGVQDPVGFPMSQMGKRLLSLCFFPHQGLFSNL